MDIITQLAAFDGKHTDSLERLVKHLSPDAKLIRTLCEIANQDDAKFQTAATWLLKRFQENGAAFSPVQVGCHLKLLYYVTHWEAKLHLLQMLPDFAIPIEQRDALHRFLKRSLGDKNKLVRAWSYNGLIELAEQYSELRPEVSELLEIGQREESASVRARIRNRLKIVQWEDFTL
ncbi:MAG: hypothetical protein AAF215_23705 [Cyanobacteria bacterium P01_A01_bin.123]